MGEGQSKLSQTDISALTSEKYTGSELKNLHAEFVKADKDKSGELDVGEFKSLLKKKMKKSTDAQLTALFNSFDADSSGSVSFKELAIALAISGSGSAEEKLKYLFDLYDEDNSGTISADELKFITTKMQQIAKTVNRGDCTAFIQAVAGKLDINQDGTISKDEWVTVGLKTPSLVALLGFA